MEVYMIVCFNDVIHLIVPRWMDILRRKQISATEKPIGPYVFLHLQLDHVHDPSLIAYAPQQSQLAANFRQLWLDAPLFVGS